MLQGRGRTPPFFRTASSHWYSFVTLNVLSCLYSALVAMLRHRISGNSGETRVVTNHELFYAIYLIEHVEIRRAHVSIFFSKWRSLWNIKRVPLNMYENRKYRIHSGFLEFASVLQIAWGQMSLTCDVFVTTFVDWWWGFEIQMLAQNSLLLPYLASVRCKYVWSRIFVGFHTKFNAPTNKSARDFFSVSTVVDIYIGSEKRTQK